MVDSMMMEKSAPYLCKSGIGDLQQTRNGSYVVVTGSFMRIVAND